MTPALACVQTNSSAARATCAPGRGSAHGSGVDLAGDRAVEQPVPARVELDLVDAVAEAVVGDQPRLVALGAPGMLLRFGGGGDATGLAHALERPSRTLALERLAQRHIAREQVDVLERDGLVGHGRRPCRQL